MPSAAKYLPYCCTIFSRAPFVYTLSVELTAIRREMRAAEGSVSRALNSILRSAKEEGMVEKDVTPTLRDGRLVIPVVPAMKRKLKGIVHDESATGKTIYIEPAEVVEANNLIRELEYAEFVDVCAKSRISVEIKSH